MLYVLSFDACRFELFRVNISIQECYCHQVKKTVICLLLCFYLFPCSMCARAYDMIGSKKRGDVDFFDLTGINRMLVTQFKEGFYRRLGMNFCIIPLQYTFTDQVK